jgi:probable HAF family extracellular repeat protein
VSTLLRRNILVLTFTERLTRSKSADFRQYFQSTIKEIKMQNRKRVVSLGKSILLFLLIATASLPLAAQSKYVVTDLGTLGGTSTSALAINNAGQVAGNSSLADGSGRAYRTAPNATINPATDVIPTLPGGTFSSVNFNAINSSGQVAGYGNVSGGLHGFRFDTDGTLNDLATLGGNNFTIAWGINDAGQVTGVSGAPLPPFATCLGTGGSYAFRTDANTVIDSDDSLGTLIFGQCRSSLGSGINSSGQVVGNSAAGNLFDPVQHAMLSTPAHSIVDLGVLGGVVQFPAASGINASAYAINGSGQIVGQSTYNHPSTVPYYANHAFLTTAAGPMQDLGTLGGAFSSATGINASGQIVGNSSTAGDAANHAFLYTGGSMYDVNSLIASTSGWEIVNAVAINDGGQIGGTGWLNGVRFVNHALRLDPANVAVTILTNLLSDPTLALTTGQVNSFTDKLNNVLASLQQGLNKQAINQLNAFANSVQVSLKNGNMSGQAGATLIAAANAIIAVL